MIFNSSQHEQFRFSILTVYRLDSGLLRCGLLRRGLLRRDFWGWMGLLVGLLVERLIERLIG